MKDLQDKIFNEYISANKLRLDAAFGEQARYVSESDSEDPGRTRAEIIETDGFKGFCDGILGHPHKHEGGFGTRSSEEPHVDAIEKVMGMLDVQDKKTGRHDAEALGALVDGTIVGYGKQYRIGEGHREAIREYIKRGSV